MHNSWNYSKLASVILELQWDGYRNDRIQLLNIKISINSEMRDEAIKENRG